MTDADNTDARTGLSLIQRVSDAALAADHLGANKLAELLREVGGTLAERPAPTPADIIERFKSLSSAAITQIIQTGEAIQRERLEDGVFE